MNQENLKILQELSELLDKERISIEEYEAQKKQLLQPTTWLWGFVQKFSFGLRSISPQVVILILVILFYGSIRKLINNASEVGFGEVFAIKVEQALRVGNPELAKVVSSLSREELVTLLDSGRGSYRLYFMNEDNQEVSLVRRFEYYIELQKKGLIESENDLETIKNIFDSKQMSKETNSLDMVLGSYEQKYYFLNVFSSEELELINGTSAELSENGRQVYSLVLNIASEEIADLRW